MRSRRHGQLNGPIEFAFRRDVVRNRSASYSRDSIVAEGTKRNFMKLLAGRIPEDDIHMSLEPCRPGRNGTGVGFESLSRGREAYHERQTKRKVSEPN